METNERNIHMKKLIIAVLATLAVAGLAPAAPANASVNGYLSALYANGLLAPPGTIAHGYWVCDILGNHSGGYVTSQVWSNSAAWGRGLSWGQSNTVVHLAIAHLCPWRWY